MKMNYLIFATAFALLSVGCSDKKEPPNDVNNQSVVKETILEDSSNVIDPKPKEPETHGCLRGCRDLPCDEAARCVKRNCPNVTIKCEKGEQEVLEDKKEFNVKPHKKILCQRGCDDVSKNSVEYENCILRNCPSAKFVR